MASFNGIIYLTTNTVNQKIYIGMSTNNDSSYFGSGTVIKKAIRKYGKKAFKKEILKDNISTIEELRFWEDFYVISYNSRNPKIGYNVAPGGINGGWKHTNEAIDKIKERSLKPDNKKLIREIQKLAVAKNKGSKRPITTRLKMSKTGKVKKILIFNLANELQDSCFLSSEASKLTGISKSAIRNNLCGLSKKTEKYIFKYEQ